MNYTINYPSRGSFVPPATAQGQSPPVGVNAQGQRTIVLSTPGQACNSNSTNNNATTQQYPMMLQLGSSDTPVFFTYQNSSKGNDIQTTGNNQ